jgi:hypothetical protein
VDEDGVVYDVLRRIRLHCYNFRRTYRSGWRLLRRENGSNRLVLRCSPISKFWSTSWIRPSLSPPTSSPLVTYVSSVL